MAVDTTAPKRNRPRLAALSLRVVFVKHTSARRLTRNRNGKQKQKQTRTERDETILGARVVRRSVTSLTVSRFWSGLVPRKERPSAFGNARAAKNRWEGNGIRKGAECRGSLESNSPATGCRPTENTHYRLFRVLCASERER